ncbi:hypothetical protein KR032_000988 [Drosophila birchii]|nr:hypothetical protein KR032_000988 [Drosophila birchii]
MQYLQPCPLRTILFILVAGVHLGRSAPRQSSFLLVPSVPFNFPEAEGPQHEPKKNPEPRQFVVEQPAELTHKDLGQLLLLANGLGAENLAQIQTQGRNFEIFHKHGNKNRDSDKDKDKDKDKDHHHHHPTVTVVVLSNPSNLTNNITNNAINDGTGTTTGTRTGDILRTPIAYPVPYPMQLFRTRGEENFPISYPGIYGWNQPSVFGGLAGSGGLGGSGLSGGLAGVPLVPITIGNEVRYVPLNLRMIRQLVNNLPVREKDDLMEEDDLTPFKAVNGEQETEEAATEEEAEAPEQTYGPLSQIRKQRRRQPFKTFTQKMRQVQFL